MSDAIDEIIDAYKENTKRYSSISYCRLDEEKTTLNEYLILGSSSFAGQALFSD